MNLRFVFDILESHMKALENDKELIPVEIFEAKMESLKTYGQALLDFIQETKQVIKDRK